MYQLEQLAPRDQLFAAFSEVMGLSSGCHLLGEDASLMGSESYTYLGVYS